MLRSFIGQGSPRRRVRHFKGEEKLRHATVQSIGPQGSLKDDLDVSRHPDDE